MPGRPEGAFSKTAHEPHAHRQQRRSRRGVPIDLPLMILITKRKFMVPSPAHTHGTKARYDEAIMQKWPAHTSRNFLDMKINKIV
jgi:hypothetical protein